MKDNLINTASVGLLRDAESSPRLGPDNPICFQGVGFLKVTDGLIGNSTENAIRYEVQLVL